MNDIVAPIDPLPKVWNPESRIGEMLAGQRGLVVGIANEHSIAFGCAAKLRAFGAELAVTYRRCRPAQRGLSRAIAGPSRVRGGRGPR